MILEIYLQPLSIFNLISKQKLGFYITTGENKVIKTEIA